MYVSVVISASRLISWLLVFETVFHSISARLTERGRKRREMTKERKMSKQTPAPIASAVGPCPTVIQISKTPGSGM